jgi:hypothetical protein
MKKGTGALAIGDAMLKGFMQGHQAKEQKKYAQAQATIAAADSSTQAAYQKYQDALTQAGGKVDDPNAKAAYDAYTGVFNQSKEAKAKFVIPEKPEKGKSQAAKGKDGKKQIPGMGGIKDFFEANQHIIPQLALLTMQPEKPGMTPQSQARSLELKEAQRTDAEANQKINDRNLIAMYGKLTPEEIKALPIAEQYKITDRQNGLAAAKSRYAMEQPAKGKFDTYVDEKGDYHSIPEGTQDIPPGWKPFVKPTAGSTPKIGTEGEFTAQAYKQYGVTPENATPQLSKYIHDWWQWKAAQKTTSANTSVEDVTGKRTATTTSTRGTGEPQPPAGFKPIEDPDKPAAGDATKPTGAITKPPTAPTASATAKPAGSRMAAPPKAPTLVEAQRTAKTETEKHDRYQKAEDKYQAALKTIKAAYAKAGVNDPKALQTSEDAALAELNKDKEGIETWYAGEVHAIGGSMPNENVVKLPDGRTITFPNKKAADSFKRDAGIQ